MYHNPGNAINKHVEAERRTSLPARYKGPFHPQGHRTFQSKIHKSEAIARRRLERNLVLQRRPISAHKLRLCGLGSPQ